MKKYLILVSLIAVITLLGFNAMAIEEVCPVGQHWVEEDAVIPGYFSDGACLEWSEPVCTHSRLELVCHNGCSYWWNWHWENVCDTWSSPTCLVYERVWNPEVIVPGGSCQNDEITESEPAATLAPQIQSFGGGETPLYTLIQGLPRPAEVNGRTVSFLTRFFGQGSLLISKTPTGVIVDMYGQPLAGSVHYDWKIDGAGVWTYHTIVIPPEITGTVYVIPAVTDYNGFIYYSNEIIINL